MTDRERYALVEEARATFDERVARELAVKLGLNPQPAEPDRDAEAA